MAIHTAAGDDRLVRTPEERDHDERWEAWRLKGARADARAHRRARWVMAALFGGAGLWLAFQVMVGSPAL